jgi:hypothetical protein
MRANAAELLGSSDSRRVHRIAAGRIPHVGVARYIWGARRICATIDRLVFPASFGAARD